MIRADMFFDGIGVGVFELAWGLLMMALWVGFWVVMIVLIVRLVRRSSHHGQRSSPALRVLEERYARGEISREEFQERRAVLNDQEPPV